MRIGTQVTRGYALQDFKEAIHRYIPPETVQQALQEARAEDQLKREAGKERVDRQEKRENNFIDRAAKAAANLLRDQSHPEAVAQAQAAQGEQEELQVQHVADDVAP